MLCVCEIKVKERGVTENFSSNFYFASYNYYVQYVSVKFTSNLSRLKKSFNAYIIMIYFGNCIQLNRIDVFFYMRE